MWSGSVHSKNGKNYMPRRFQANNAYEHRLYNRSPHHSEPDTTRTDGASLPEPILWRTREDDL